MEILVTGGAGYIGSHVIEALHEKGHSVHVFDKFIYSYRPPSKFKLIEGDIRDPKSVDVALKGPIDAVIHLAGLANDPSADLNEELSVSIMRDGTRLLAEKAKDKGIKKFIFASSCSVYGAQGDKLLTEESEVRPVSLYAQLKLEGEKILKGLADNNFKPTCLRLATVYGLSPRMRLDLVVNIMSAKAVWEKRVQVFGGKQWRPNIHVADVARAFALVTESQLEAVGGKTYNVGSNEQNYQIFKIGESVFNCIPGIELDILSENSDNRSYHVKFDKIQNELGFKATHTIESAVMEIQKAISEGVLTDLNNIEYYSVNFLLKRGGI